MIPADKPAMVPADKPAMVLAGKSASLRQAEGVILLFSSGTLCGNQNPQSRYVG